MTASVLLTSESMPRLFYSVSNAMWLLDMGRTELYEEIRSGRLKSVKRGRRRLISHDALLAYKKLLEDEQELLNDD